MDDGGHLHHSIALLAEAERQCADLIENLSRRGMGDPRILASLERERRLSAKLRMRFERDLAKLDTAAARAARAALAEAWCPATRH